MEALPGGGPRSLVGILKCLVSAFCQGFMSLSEIERHTFVLVVILIKFVYTLTALQTKDIWHIFCFSCPFLSFEARSNWSKLLQFFVANFQL